MPSVIDKWVEEAMQAQAMQATDARLLPDQLGSAVQISIEDLKRLADPLAGIPALDRVALRNLATARTFDQELVEQCLVQGLPGNPSFADLVNMPYVEEIPGRAGHFRIESSTRQDLLKSWWSAGTSRAIIPQGLRELSRCLADAYGGRGDELEQLYHLIAANRNQARSLFRRLFDEADSRFDLPRCHVLLRILEERQDLLGPALAALQKEKRLRLEARSMWAQEYYETIVYFERDVTRHLMPDLIKGKGHWILHLYALGGIGKTMFIRASIARHCVPRGIPCARIDFDFVPHMVEAAREPWRLLLRIADQLNRQLSDRPFEELLADYARYMAEAGARRMTRVRPVTPVGPDEQERIRREVVDRFVATMGNVRKGQPYLVVFDTLEELRLRQIDLSAAFDLLQELYQESPGLRVILSGRYNLEEALAGNLESPTRLTGFVERFSDQEHTVQLLPFNGDEARVYLEQRRGMAGDMRLRAIIGKGEGNPFKLALLADIARDNPDLTAQEIEEYAAVDLVYLINRVVDRIRDDMVKWLLRYGVVPRILTLDFVAKVMVPYIERGIAGDTTHDKPSADRLPAQVLARDLFPIVLGASPLNAQAIWQALTQYASQVSWVYAARGVPDALTFHPEVVEPMRYLLQEQGRDQRDIYLTLNREAAAYFEECAQKDPDNRARWLREAVYHYFQVADSAAAADYWRRQIAAAADDSETAVALAEEVLWLPRRAGQRTADGRIQVLHAGDDLMALAAYELAWRRLESGLPLSKTDWSQLKDWLAIAESSASRQALHASQLAHLRGRVLLADLHVEEALRTCLQALQRPADYRNEMELHLLAADALQARRRASDEPEIARHYLQALELAQEVDPRRVTRIAPSLAQNLEAGEHYVEAAKVYHQLYDAALAAVDLNRIAEWSLSLLEIQVTMGREVEAVRLGEEGLSAFLIAPSQGHQGEGGQPLDPSWRGVLKAAIDLIRLRLGSALSELNQALRPSAKGRGTGILLEAPEEWRAQDNEWRARIETARLNVVEAVACLEKLAWDIHRPTTSAGMRSLQACARLFIDTVGDPRRAERYLASMRENERHYDPSEGWTVRRRLLEIQCLLLADTSEAVRQQVSQLAQEVDSAWRPTLRAQVAMEWLIQTGASADALEGLIMALETVQPASRRLALLEELKRCTHSQFVAPEQAARLLTLLPDPAAEGQDLSQAALRLAEVHRVIGHVEEARTLISQAEEAGREPLRLVLLRRVFLAHDRLGWQERDLTHLPLPASDDSAWEECRELSGLLLLEHAERLVRELGDFERAASLLERAADFLGDPSSLWTPRLAVLRSAIAFARDESKTGEIEWRRAVTAFRAQGNRQGILSALELALAVAKRVRVSDPRVAEISNSLGNVLREQGEVDGAKTAFGRAVELAPAESPDLPFYLNNLGNTVSARYARTGSLGDLEEAIKVYRRAVSLAPTDSPSLPSFINNLATSLRDRYARSGYRDDLEEAEVMRVFRQVIALTPPDSPNLPAYLSNLGVSLRDRYLRAGLLEDLDEAIRYFRQAIERTPLSSPNLPAYLSNLGASLRDLYISTGRLDVLEEAISSFQQATERTPPDSRDLPSYLSNQGNSLRDRYAHTRRLDDLEGAIRCFHLAIQREPVDSPALPGYLSSLGNVRRDRYLHLGRMEDLEEAILVYQQAVTQTPSGSPDLPRYLNNLANGLSHTYIRSGRLEDLEEAITCLEQAVQSTPSGASDRAGYLNNLGNGLRIRYARTGQFADLVRAITCFEQAIQGTPSNSPDLPSILNNLGIGLRERYSVSGSMGDMAEAIRAYERAVQLTPPDSPDLPPRVNNLANILRDRFGITGDSNDLQKAIELYLQAVERTSPDSLYLPSYLSNLGNAYADMPTGDRAENLEQAIHHFQQALEVYTRAAFPEQWAATQNNLAIAYRSRIRGERADNLEQAIHHFQQALEVYTRAAFPEQWAATQNNLAIAYRSRIRGDRVENLEQAIEAWKRAVEAAAPDSLDRPVYLDNLATGLRARYDRTGSPDDLAEAKVALERAVQLTPPDSPDLPGYVKQLSEVSQRVKDISRLTRDGKDSISVEQNISSVQGSTVVGIRIGKLVGDVGDVDVHLDVGAVEAGGEVQGVRVDDLSSSDTSALLARRRVVSIKPDSPSTWQVVLRQQTLGGDTTVLSRQVELPGEMQAWLTPRSDESISPTFVKEFARNWLELSARLGKLLFPMEIRTAFLGGDTSFILYWELEDPQLGWLPWELVRADLGEPPLALTPARPYVMRRLARPTPPRKPERGVPASVDVLIVRAGQAIEQAAERGVSQQTGPDLLRQYASRGARVEELSRPEPWALAEAVDRLRPRAMHILAGIRDHGRRLLLDFGAEGGYTKTEASFSPRDLTNVLLKTQNPPLVLLDPPTPPGIYERLRQLCLRNAFAAELALASDAPLVILATGLGDPRQQPKLTDTLVAGLAKRRPFGEVARRISALADQSFPASAWGKPKGRPTLEAVLPFLGTALFADDPLPVFVPVQE